MDLFHNYDTTKPCNSIKNLVEGSYEIIKFRLVCNNFYSPDRENSPRRVILVELQNQVTFLPQYMATNFRDDDQLVDELNNDGKKRFLCIDGHRPDE